MPLYEYAYANGTIQVHAEPPHYRWGVRPVLLVEPPPPDYDGPPIVPETVPETQTELYNAVRLAECARRAAVARDRYNSEVAAGRQPPSGLIAIDAWCDSSRALPEPVE